MTTETRLLPNHGCGDGFAIVFSKGSTTNGLPKPYQVLTRSRVRQVINSRKSSYADYLKTHMYPDGLNTSKDQVQNRATCFRNDSDMYSKLLYFHDHLHLISSSAADSVHQKLVAPTAKTYRHSSPEHYRQQQQQQHSTKLRKSRRTKTIRDTELLVDRREDYYVSRGLYRKLHPQECENTDEDSLTECDHDYRQVIRNTTDVGATPTVTEERNDESDFCGWSLFLMVLAVAFRFLFESWRDEGFLLFEEQKSKVESALLASKKFNLIN